MALTQRGKATIAGITGTIDVVVYPVLQSAKANHSFEEEKVADNNGSYVAWLARNEEVQGDFEMRLIGDSTANASLGTAFLSPLQIITLHDFLATPFNGIYQYVGGSVDLKSNEVGSKALKLRRYVDSGQNILATTTPS